jgi:hypothetical protein
VETGLTRLRANSEIAPNPNIRWAVQARARLNGFDVGPRLDNGKELYGILFRADFYVAETINKVLDEPPLPDRILLHAGEGIAARNVFDQRQPDRPQAIPHSIRAWECSDRERAR